MKAIYLLPLYVLLFSTASMNAKNTNFKTDVAINKIESDSVKVQKTDTLIEKKVMPKTTFLPSKHNTKKNKNVFTLTANIGVGYRIAETPKGLDPILKSHIDKLKTGLSYDISGYFMINNEMGLGLKYNSFNSDNTVNNLRITYPDGSMSFGSMSDNINIQFIGASFISTFAPSKLGEGYVDLSIGYCSYEDKANLGRQKITITGGTLGLNGSIGYQFKITPQFLIGPQINYSLATLTSVEITENGVTRTQKLEKDHKEGLGRVDLSIGARYKF